MTSHLPATPHLLRSLERATAEDPFGRKFLVCRRPAEGRELLQALSASGAAWIGWETVTVRQIAHDLVALDLARAGVQLADEFYLLSLADEAIDRVADQGRAGPFQALSGLSGVRDALRSSLSDLRSAGVAPETLRRSAPEDPKIAALAAVLGEYEALLRARRTLDPPGVLAAAAKALREGRARLPEGAYYAVPGHEMRGRCGELLELVLRQPNADVLEADSVLGLSAPAGVLWNAPEEPTGPLSCLQDPCRDVPRPSFSFFAAASPADELREVLRRVLESGATWDEVEIVATDPYTYGSALDALLRRLDIPATYAAGLDNRRTRLGRAVHAYFRWITEGYPADLLRGLLESGDLTLPAADGEERCSGSRLARRLRRLRVGWGRDRYLPAIDRAIQALEKERRSEDVDREDALAAAAREKTELLALRSLLAPILAAAPPEPKRGEAARTSPAGIARALQAFLAFVPAEGLAERTALGVFRGRLARAEATLTRETRLEAAVATLKSRLETRLAPGSAAGVEPWTSAGGRLHLSDLETGGLACRPYTFVVGLDAGRARAAGSVDPVLSDADRQRVNQEGGAGPPALSTVPERMEEARHRLLAMLARLRGGLTLSYSAWDGAEGRAVSAAPELLQALRLREAEESLTYRDLREALGALACAVPRGRAALDLHDVWLEALASGPVLREGTGAVRAAFAGLGRGHAARAARSGGELTAYHGRITPDESLDPRSQDGMVFSATRLEALGACPRKFFYRYVLGTVPVRDPDYDADVWLDALERGTLLHGVYERALKEARGEGVELSGPEFGALARRILDDEVARALSRCPAPSLAVFESEHEALVRDLESFVTMIGESPPHWVHLEFEFGAGERQAHLTVGGGRIKIRGAVDRVDEVRPGTYRIVDYKTGGADWYKPASPFKGGRRIQHVLYARAAEQLLGGEVDSMEYHFPTRKGQNQVVRYRKEALEKGTDVLEALFQIAAEGHFVATEDASDCKFCEFGAVCRAETDDYGKVSCAPAAWSKENGESLPEYERLLKLRAIDA